MGSGVPKVDKCLMSFSQPVFGATHGKADTKSEPGLEVRGSCPGPTRPPPERAHRSGQGRTRAEDNTLLCAQGPQPSYTGYVGWEVGSKQIYIELRKK